MYCQACDYDLRGLDKPSGSGPSHHACPECGRGYDPADASTTADRPQRTRHRAWLIAGWCSSVFLLLFVSGPMLQWGYVRYVQGQTPSPMNHPGPLEYYITPFMFVSLITLAPIWTLIILVLSGMRLRGCSRQMHLVCWISLLALAWVVGIVSSGRIFDWWID